MPSITLQLFCLKNGLKRTVRSLGCTRPCEDKRFLAKENVHTAFQGINCEAPAEFKAWARATCNKIVYWLGHIFKLKFIHVYFWLYEH